MAATDPTDPSDLRGRLEAERTALLGELEMNGHLQPGVLNLIGGVQLALQALDSEQTIQTAPMNGRVLIRDVTGDAMALVVFLGDSTAAQVELQPLHALALAADLTEAARRRLSASGPANDNEHKGRAS